MNADYAAKEHAMSEPNNIPIRALKIEEGSQEILKSPSMQPYMQLALMVVKQQDPKEALEEISELPLEKRYIWRIASALKWAF